MHLYTDLKLCNLNLLITKLLYICCRSKLAECFFVFLLLKNQLAHRIANCSSVAASCLIWSSFVIDVKRSSPNLLLMDKKLKKNISELVRFGIVGSMAMAIHYGVYWFLIKIINPTLAYTAGYGISLIFNFLLSTFFTFKTKPNYKKGIRFVLSHGINYLLHIILLQVFLHIGVPEVYAPFPVLAIAVPVNFILVRAALASKHRS